MLANHAPASNDSPQGDSDYETILTALMASARGRSFLDEYLRRNRNPDTGSLLTAIGRIEEVLRSRGLEPDQVGIRAASEAASEPTNAVPAPDASEFVTPDATRREAAVVDSGGRADGPMHDATPNGMMPLDVNPAETASAEIAEIDMSPVEVPETYASAIEFLGPQLQRPAASDDIPAPAERTDKQSRDPFADFYALSNEEKIALFA